MDGFLWFLLALFLGPAALMTLCIVVVIICMTILEIKDRDT